MGTLVTTEVAVAYTHCPRKAFLLLNTADPPPHEYEALCQARGAAHQERYLAQIRRDGGEVVQYSQDGLRAGHRHLVGVDLRAGDLSATCDVLVPVDQPSCPATPSYLPQMIAGTYSVTDDQRLALSLAGHALELSGGSPPDFGRIITLDDVTHKVALADKRRKIASVLIEVRALADRDSKAP